MKERVCISDDGVVDDDDDDDEAENGHYSEQHEKIIGSIEKENAQGNTDDSSEHDDNNESFSLLQCDVMLYSRQGGDTQEKDTIGQSVHCGCVLSEMQRHI